MAATAALHSVSDGLPLDGGRINLQATKAEQSNSSALRPERCPYPVYDECGSYREEQIDDGVQG